MGRKKKNNVLRPTSKGAVGCGYQHIHVHLQVWKRKLEAAKQKGDPAEIKRYIYIYMSGMQDGECE